jgi:hypothetical protein
MEKITTLYTDYLMSRFGRVMVTTMSSVLEEDISHDKITSYFAENQVDRKRLWLSANLFVKKYLSGDVFPILDDTVIEKHHNNEDEHNCWRCDYSNGRNNKDIDLLKYLYHVETDEDVVRCPMNYRLMGKPIIYVEVFTGKENRKGLVIKNGVLREMVSEAVHNQLLFRFILDESWFWSIDNMRHIPKEKKLFILEVKANLLACRDGYTERDNIQWTGITGYVHGTVPGHIYLKGLYVRAFLIKESFTNKGSSSGERYLVSHDLDLEGYKFMVVYKKWWDVEDFHKGIKQKASTRKSSTNSLTTRVVKIFHIGKHQTEKATISPWHEPFSHEAKVNIAAIKAAYQNLNRIKD